MIGAEAGPGDREGAAHQRLGLGEAVRGLEQLGEVVEADGDVGVIGAEAGLGDREGAAHQRLGLREAVRGLEQQGEVVEVAGDCGVIGAEARLVGREGAAHQRLGLREAVRGLQQLGEVVEADGDGGVIGAEAGLGDGEGAAHQRLGLREAVRGVEQLGEVVEVYGDRRVIGAEAGLVDHEGAAHQRLGLTVEGLGGEIQRQPAHQHSSGLGVNCCFRAGENGRGVGTEGAPHRPGANVVCVEGRIAVDQAQDRFDPVAPAVWGYAPPEDLLDHGVDGEGPLAPDDEAIGVEVGEGVADGGLWRSGLPGLVAEELAGGVEKAASLLEEGDGDGVGGEEGGEAEKRGGGRAEVVEAALPGHRHRFGIGHDQGVVPGEHLLALGRPGVQVGGEAQPALRNVGGGLLEGQGEAAEKRGQAAGGLGIVGARAAAAGGAPVEEGCGFGGREGGERLAVEGRSPAGPARGDQDVAGREAGQQLRDGRRGLPGVCVVEDEEPAGRFAEPAQHRRDGLVLVRRLALGEIEEVGGGEGGEAAAEAVARVGAHEERRRVAAAVAPGVLDREAGLADAAEAGEQLVLGDGGGAGIVEVRRQVQELLLAPGEERAQREIREVVAGRAARSPGGWRGAGAGLDAGDAPVEQVEAAGSEAVAEVDPGEAAQEERQRGPCGRAGQEHRDDRQGAADTFVDGGAHLRRLPGAEAIAAEQDGGRADDAEGLFEGVLPAAARDEVGDVDPGAQAAVAEGAGDGGRLSLVVAVVAQEDVEGGSRRRRGRRIGRRSGRRAGERSARRVRRGAGHGMRFFPGAGRSRSGGASWGRRWSSSSSLRSPAMALARGGSVPMQSRRGTCRSKLAPTSPPRHRDHLPPPAERWRAAQSDYIRQSHGQRSSDLVRRFDTDPRWTVLGTPLAQFVARLCLSHVRPARDLNATNGFRHDEVIGIYRINMPYLGLLLRLADILDFDRDRTPDSLYRSLHVRSQVSLAEWAKHRAVEGWSIGPSLIQFTMRCEHPEYQRAAYHFMDAIDRELAEAHARRQSRRAGILPSTSSNDLLAGSVSPIWSRAHTVFCLNS